MIAVRPPDDLDITFLIIAAAIALIGLVALAAAVLCDDPEVLPEFDDLETPTSPRSLR